MAEQEVSREAVTALGRDYVAQQRTHMRMENERFFQIAERTLTQADWAEVDSDLAQTSDPLFGPKVAEEYEVLRDHLLQW